MRNKSLSLLVALAGAAAGVAIALGAPPATAFLAWLLFSALVATWVATLRVSRLRSPATVVDRPPSPEEWASRTEDLADTERLVRLSLERLGAGDLHFRLRPVLSGICTELLSISGVDPSDGAGAEKLLGRDCWELVRPGRPPPEERLSAGITLSSLSEIVDRLEHLAQEEAHTSRFAS